MATKAEEFHAEEERAAQKKNRKRAPKRGPVKKKQTHAEGRVAEKATYALEKTAEGKRPSRKSSRKSANRSKADASFNITEERKKTSSDARFRKDRAAKTRVRGSSTPK
jgi:hypothetical protein